MGIYFYNIYSKCSIGYNWNCKRECNVDSDCKFNCGCGAINKNEKCNDFGNLAVDCNPSISVKCENNECKVINYNDNKTCIESGGTLRKPVCLGKFYICIYNYSDAGKLCNSSDECKGECIVTDNDRIAKCKADSDPCGCFSTIENFRNYGNKSFDTCII